MIPATSNSKLVKMWREISKSEAEGAMKFKIIETVGRSIKSRVSYRDQTLLQHIAALSETVWYVQEEGGRGGDVHILGKHYVIGTQ